MKQEIQNSLEVLRSGGLLLYPTDTIWGIGCDATNAEAVQKVYNLKQRADSKALICMVASDGMLQKHINKVPDLAWDIIDLSEKPTTIVYDQPKEVAKNLIAADNTLAVRLTKHPFCQKLIHQFGKPIVSTSANISGMPAPSCFNEIQPEILKGVDYVVDLHRKEKCSSPSAIIKLSNTGIVKVIRS